MPYLGHHSNLLIDGAVIVTYVIRINLGFLFFPILLMKQINTKYYFEKSRKKIKLFWTSEIQHVGKFSSFFFLFKKYMQSPKISNFSNKHVFRMHWILWYLRCFFQQIDLDFSYDPHTYWQLFKGFNLYMFCSLKYDTFFDL